MSNSTGQLTAGNKRPISVRLKSASPTAPSALLRSDKITDEHLDRLAIVYVRQSTQHQVLEHRESTARQYALADRALALGWPTAAVEVIDEDQRSQRQFRSGAERLWTLAR